MRQKVECLLWLAELKSYTHVRQNLNHMYTNQTALIYRPVMWWDKCLKKTRLISWLPCSPELTLLDFSFKGFVTDTVYHEKVQNVNEL
jgi:hypothetical protein